MKTEQELLEKAVKLQKAIIQEAWNRALADTIHLSLSWQEGREETPSAVEISNLDEGIWEELQHILMKLPVELDTSSEENLTLQFEALKLSAQEMDTLKCSLWIYFEEYEMTFNLTDDGMDEAEQSKDVLPYLIEKILDRSREVLHPTFLGYHHVECWLLDNGTPIISYDQKKKKKMVKIYSKPVMKTYNEALKLWLKENEDIK